MPGFIYVSIAIYAGNPIISIIIPTFVSDATSRVKYFCISSAKAQIKISPVCNKYANEIYNIKIQSCFHIQARNRVISIIKDAEKNNCRINFYD